MNIYYRLMKKKECLPLIMGGNLLNNNKKTANTM